MIYPKRRKAAKMGVRQSPWIRLPGHLQWVAGHDCILAGKHECSGRVRACHLRLGTDGCGGEKPSDCWTWPGCDGAHEEQHRIGEESFQKKYRLDLKDITKSLWDRSPHGNRYRYQTRHAEELKS